jgi:hypothetical protein
MSNRKTSALQHLTAVFGTQAHVEQLETALRTAAEHHTELAAHLRTRRDVGHFDVPDPLITRDGAQLLADNHDRRATTYTALADLITVALDTDDEDPR